MSGDMVSTTNNVEEVASRIDKEALEAQKMLELAAAQRMNTDARRAIFCIIMSGEDYIDAFEKILRLDLPGKQVSILFFLRKRDALFITSCNCLFEHPSTGQRYHAGSCRVLLAREGF